MTGNTNIDRLAQLAGVEPEYWDIWGQHHPIADGNKRLILRALGFNVDSEKGVHEAARAAEEADWQRRLPPVLVTYEDERAEVTVTLPADGVMTSLPYEVIEEKGRTRRGEFVPARAPLRGSRVVGGRELRRYTMPLPERLPVGYHVLSFRDSAGDGMRLIVAPRRCYLPEALGGDGKVWGIAAQLYALRRPGDWGIGDFTALAELVDVAVELGASVVGLNPLHALFPEVPEWASPYSPSSRLFLNPLYIDVEAIPEYAGCASARALADELAADLVAARDAAYVDYPLVTRLKLKVLQALYDAFHHQEKAGGGGQPRVQEFRRFCQEAGEDLRRFAVFSALSETFEGRPWQDWPSAYRRPDSPEVQAFTWNQASRVEFYEYLQWIADGQLAAVKARGEAKGLAIGLYIDLAVGAARQGADAWGGQDVIVQQATVGCPPDPFNMLGQNWSIPPLHPLALREQGYQPFIAMLRANMRHAGALRIDHVMGLMHLFWIPMDDTPASGAYVQYPFEDLLAILALESQRNRCLVVGEDLGTVPDGFRERMAKANVLSYRVLIFEKDGDRFKRPEDYPALALACVTTHDLATLAGFWNGADIRLKTELDLYPSPQAIEKEWSNRQHDRRQLLAALAKEDLLPDGRAVGGRGAALAGAEAQTAGPAGVAGAARGGDVDRAGDTLVEAARTGGRGATGSTPAEATTLDVPLAAALHEYLALAPSKILLVQIDDLMGEVEQINLPGTTFERPNWRRKLARTVRELTTCPLTKALVAALKDRGARA